MTPDETLQSAVEYHQKGNLREAERILRGILHVQPDNIETLYFLAEIVYQLGKYDSAEQYVRNALMYDPANAEAYNNLGIILQAKKQLDTAIQSYQKAAELNPNLPDVYMNMGLCFKEKGQIDSAAECYQKALELNPGMTDAYINLGIAFQTKGKFDDAIMYCQKALQINPYDANLHYNLGIALQEKGQLDEAVTCYREALQLNPLDAVICNNLAFALQENGRPYEAMPYYQKALQLNSGYATAHWNMSLALLLTGNFREGWKEYEWRWETEYLTSSRRDFQQPLWNGSDIKGSTILLHAEQGLGDTIQFIRYAPLVAQRGARIIFECFKELTSLLQFIDGIEQVVTHGEELPEFDVHCPLLSLPLVFNTTIETIPANVPYLKSEPMLTNRWKERMQHDKSRCKVGIAWAGNPGFKQNRFRNSPLDIFLTLAHLHGVALYSLQKGEEAKQTKNLPENVKLFDYTDQIVDFSDTAALMENLDLIISVDTAVAHLAGALGKPVWTLLPFSPEWRWLLKREDTPWYPTMRLFRQSSLGDWESVMVRVLNELQRITD
ncbi:MAG: tetratricopeptide repeat protein [Nitrospira sp.]|nr:tetratricopeptide repeat protein [Nitrospira sp.]